MLKNTLRINSQIRSPELRVINEEGNLGVMSLAEANRLAEEAELDLIEISPEAKPPVAKIMDYGKFLYQQKQKNKQAKTGSKTTETKNLQIKIGTGDHDLELKAKKASEFLRQGHRVKMDLFLPGRAKYLDQQFLRQRLDRVLKLISEEFQIADPAKKSPKGLTIIIERGRSQKKSEGGQS